MVKTTDVAMIAGQVFGMPDSHVMEIIRRIREQDLYVRETRSISNRPKATPRHLANLVGALMTGASSRMAAQAVERLENCIVNTHYFQKFFRTNQVRLGEEFDLFFDNAKWAESRIDRKNTRAPLRRMVETACDDEKYFCFNILDLMEIVIEALADCPDLFSVLALSAITYDADRNEAELEFLISEWDSEVNQYMPKENEGGFPFSFTLDFSDENNDFQGLVDRKVTITFEMLVRFAKALRRGEA